MNRGFINTSGAAVFRARPAASPDQPRRISRTV